MANCGGGDPNRRPMEDAWARDLRDQAREQSVAFFFKQHSAFRSGQDPFLDGELIQEFPEVPHA